MSAEKSRIVEFVSFVMSTRWIETINKDKQPAQKLPGCEKHGAGTECLSDKQCEINAFPAHFKASWLIFKNSFSYVRFPDCTFAHQHTI